MVDGADYFLLCHDDVALSPDTIHLLVEEAFRSNAGIVSPKVVSWDDPDRLVHVGMTVDKGGSVVDRLQPGEIDHGQHDAVRDVFVAPGGVTLVRTDLFQELGGFDPAIVAMGEDLDLCWRAQVAGARIIVAPDARVRHLEELASGARPVERSLRSSAGDPGGAESSSGTEDGRTGGRKKKKRAPRNALRPCRSSSDVTSSSPCSSATARRISRGCCRRSSCSRWAKSSSRRLPETVPGPTRWSRPGAGTSAASGSSAGSARSSRVIAG